MARKPDIGRLIEFHRLLLDFQKIERIVHLPGKFDLENDTEHSYNLALAAWYLAEYFPELDRDKIIRFALIHDLVEVHAGDTYIFAVQSKIDSKKKREHEALKKLEKDWPDFPDMISGIKDYETMRSEEAKFIYALDKIMPVIVIFLAEGYTWKKENLTLDKLYDNKASKVAVSDAIKPYYDELYKLLSAHKHYFSQAKKKRI
jgi:putative hydrolase of HD superfamily